MNPREINDQHIVKADNQNRIQYIQRGTIVMYSQAIFAINRFNYIIQQPPSHRMIGALLYGPSGS